MRRKKKKVKENSIVIKSVYMIAVAIRGYLRCLILMVPMRVQKKKKGKKNRAKVALHPRSQPNNEIGSRRRESRPKWCGITCVVGSVVTLLFCCC